MRYFFYRGGAKTQGNSASLLPSGEEKILPQGRKGAGLEISFATSRLCGSYNLLKIAIVLSLLIACRITVPGQNKTHTADDFPFQPGEYLKYRVYYDSWVTYWMTAGFGIMEIDKDMADVKGREAYHITVTGNSANVFNMFYKVRDKFESFMDEDSLYSLKFIRKTHEGKYKRNDEILFDHQELKATSTRKVSDITPGIQDIVSAFYHMRTLNFDSAEINDEYFMDFFLDDSLYHSKIVFLGRETVETELGIFHCMKFKPEVAQGEIFQEPYPMELWVSDDKNKIPILAKSAVYIGSVKVELIEYKGLKWELGGER